MKNGTILIADDNKDILESLKQLLKYDFDQIIAISDPDKILFALSNFPVDLILHEQVPNSLRVTPCVVHHLPPQAGSDIIPRDAMRR